MKLSESSHRTVVSNIFSLSFVQIANIGLPFVTLPYVIQVVGPENFGLISFAQAFVTYFVLLVNYGFDLSASREIAGVRNDSAAVRRVFWTVIWTKCVLGAGSTVLFLVMIATIPQLRQNWRLICVTYAVLAGWVIFPTWYYQGVERLGRLATFNFLVKLGFALGIFLFLREKEDYLIVPSLTSAGQIIVGSIALKEARGRVGSAIRPSFIDVKACLQKGWMVFLSTVFINFYTVTNTVILGFFTSSERLGYFAAGARLVSALQSILTFPVTVSLYPRITHIMSTNMGEGKDYVKKVALIVAGLTVPVALILWIFAPFIVSLLFGREFQEASRVVRILAPLVVVVSLGSVFGILGLLNMNLDRIFFRVILTGAVICVTLNVILVQGGDEGGTSIAWLVTELFVMVAFLYALHVNGLRIVDPSFYRTWWSQLAKKK